MPITIPINNIHKVILYLITLTITTTTTLTITTTTSLIPNYKYNKTVNPNR